MEQFRLRVRSILQWHLQLYDMTRSFNDAYCNANCNVAQCSRTQKRVFQIDLHPRALFARSSAHIAIRIAICVITRVKNERDCKLNCNMRHHTRQKCARLQIELQHLIFGHAYIHVRMQSRMQFRPIRACRSASQR